MQPKVLIGLCIETCYLTDDEKRIACQLSVNSGAVFVKTSTGFGKGGATETDVKLMKESIPDGMKVKASGGIHLYEEAISMARTDGEVRWELLT